MAQLVEYDLAKVGVAGSSPVSRSYFFVRNLDFIKVPFFFYHLSCRNLNTFLNTAHHNQLNLSIENLSLKARKKDAGLRGVLTKTLKRYVKSNLPFTYHPVVI